MDRLIKCKSGYLSLHLDNFSVNVIIVYSKEVIECVIANKNINNQHVFMMLLMEMVKNWPNNYVIIIDNASIQKIKMLENFETNLIYWHFTHDSYEQFLKPVNNQ